MTGAHAPLSPPLLPREQCLSGVTRVPGPSPKLSARRGTVNRMTAQPGGPQGTGGPDLTRIGGEAAVVVPLPEYRRLRALEQLASADELEGAEAAASLEEYREWSAAGRPGAITHEQARRLLLGEPG